MDIRTPFINEYGRLRSGWRLVVFLAAVIACYFLLSTLVWAGWSIVHATGVRIPFERSISELVYRFLLLAGALIAGYVCCWALERLPWRSLGLTLHQRWFRDFLVGSLI